MRKTDQFLFCFLICLSGCTKWISVDPPVTQTVSTVVFSDPGSANSAVAGMYSYMYQLNNNQSSFGGYHLSLYSSVAADELFLPGSPSDPFFTNKIQKENEDIEKIWSSAYSAIYSANSIIEGMKQSTSISEPQKNQFLGEALFIRSFAHFYLTNLFGDVPLILSNDVNLTKNIGRTASDSVYTQIITDLIKAESMLPENYDVYGGERVRATKWVAKALLSRIYLYRGQWGSAENEASLLINKTELFGLESNLETVFLKNSQEAIWQIIGYGGQGVTTVGKWLNGSITDPPAFAITKTLINSFEPGDLRFSNWVRQQINSPDTFYIPNKYKNSGTVNVNEGEYDMVFRLAEQWLIRAESKTQQNNLQSGLDDLNVVRSRAGIATLSLTSKDSILAAINTERNREFFSEWSHRWFDLKRTNTIDQILGSQKPDWKPYAALYPIPVSEIGNNPLLFQNPGY